MVEGVISLRKANWITCYQEIIILYDSFNLPTVYNAADNIPWAQFPMPCELLERRL